MTEVFNNDFEVLESVKTKNNNDIVLIGNFAKNSETVLQNFSDSAALIIGVFHGDEPQGKYLIDKYLAREGAHRVCEVIGRGVKNSILFIPCLNPDGIDNNTRTNANGVDLNRNFPTENWGQDTSAAGNNPQDYYSGKSAASEIETKFVIDIIEKYRPKLILTLHAPYKIVNYDGPAKEIAQKISDIIYYPVEESIGYPTPGSFGTYCGVERNIPTITLELDEEIPIEQLEQPVFEIFDMLQNV